MRSRRTREGAENSGEHRPHRQLTIVAAVVGETVIPELDCRATPENAERPNVHATHRPTRRRIPTMEQAAGLILNTVCIKNDYFEEQMRTQDSLNGYY